MTFFYRAYALTIISDAALPGLYEESAATPQCDVELTVGAEPAWVREALRLTSCVVHPPGVPEGHDSVNLTSLGAEDFYQLAYSDGTRFIVDSQARRLWGACQPPLTLEDFATYLSGPVLGFVLQRRGVHALHASSLCIDGRAVIICGESGSGKSTTLAALALRKFAVLAEDISPIREESGTLYAEPGYPRICLWPDTVEKLFGASDALPRLTPTWEKHFLSVDGVQARFESQHQPLGAVYLLSPRTSEMNAPRIEELSRRDALILLVQNTYMNWVLDRARRAAELDLLTKVVERVPVRRVIPYIDPSRIDALCDLIAEDARRLFAAQESTVNSFHG